MPARLLPREEWPDSKPADYFREAGYRNWVETPFGLYYIAFERTPDQDGERGEAYTFSWVHIDDATYGVWWVWRTDFGLWHAE